MESHLELSKLAEAFATKAHSGQKRKNGDNYKTHLLRVVVTLQSEDSENIVTLLASDKRQEVMAVAWLHDVVEDTKTTIEEIREQFGDEIAEAVRLLTRPDHLSYKAYGRRLIESENLLAIIVKYVDLYDNLKQIGDGTFPREEEAKLEERWTDLFDKIGEYLKQRRTNGNDNIST